MLKDNFVTDQQLKKMSKVFRLSGKTFQQTARDAGLKDVPDHAAELTYIEARKFLKHFGYYFNMKKDKQ